MLGTSYRQLFNNTNINTIICKVFKSHYEALNIPKTATHKEIKDAYYRLSMIYHPDKNKGSEEASKIFRDINSAYEILGNVRQRRIYDNKINPNQRVLKYNSNQPFETMNSKSGFYKTNAGNKDYSFDDWSKAQYTYIFQKYHEDRERLSRKKSNEESASKQHTYSLLSIMIFISLFIIVSMFEHIKMFLKRRERIGKKSDF